MNKKPKRNPLEKETFLSGVRQQWCGIFIFYSFVILTTQILYKVDPSPYMNFAITIGSLFILGGSVDSFVKIQAARSIKEKEMDGTQEPPAQD